MAVTLLATKLLSATALFICSLVFGLMPFYLVKWFYSKGIFRTARVRAFINGVICFSGGTLIGVAFLHLMPEMREKVQKMHLEESTWTPLRVLSVSDVLTCSGFFFVYIFDELMHMSIEWYNTRRANNPVNLDSQTAREMEVGDKAPESDRSLTPRNRQHHTKGSSCFPCICQTPLSRPFHHPDSHNRPHHTLVSVPASPVGHTDSSSRHSPHRHVANPEEEEEEEVHAYPAHPLAGLIMIIALSLHDIFEGLAVGIEDDTHGVLFLCISIAAHKYAIAFCIGMDLVMNHTSFTVLVLYMLTYSIVSPLGIIVGIFITLNADHGDNGIATPLDTPATVVLQGLAGGTLIYVVCFEILQREGSDTHMKGICNVVFVLVGFLVTAGIKVLFGHPHHDER